ncbi:MAG TPA: glycoside hydrolase family 76 protein [Tepidisphaeraceae bacterium]|nr:glycoside hydrolase family 76 protein [Tepidisphaeraceae bacterium]
MLIVLPAMAQTRPTTRPAVSFLEAARTVTASIQKVYYDQKTGLYARSLTKRDPEYIWGNGVVFSALVAAARHEPAIYRPIMNRFFADMDRYWDTKSKIPAYEPAPTAGNGHDKYYDDNQWMVITFMEAYDLTQDVRYLNRAQETLVFSLSGWDDELGGGIWWHELHKAGSKNTCANGPAAVACLRVARYRQRPENLEWARKVVKWTNEHLQDQDGLFFDNQRVADGRVNRGKLTYNTALMLRANLGLYRATGEAKFLDEAKRIGAACSFFLNQKTGAYRDALKYSHLLVEADLELYRATGDASALARARRNGEVAWSRWQESPPKELIEQASLARMLWLLADQETETGRAFWAKADTAVGATR